MNVKRIIASALTATTLIATLGTITVSAYVVVTDNPHRPYVNVQTYEARYVDDYATHYACPQYTAVKATSDSYYGSYKWVQYIQYGESDGNLYRIVTKTNSGTTQTVAPPPVTVSDEVACRTQLTELHYTSNTSSSIIEAFRAFIKKEK